MLAALAGAIVYFAVLKLTGYEIGLIAVAVGFAVGHSVRWGSYSRGGRVYQAIAVTLTYMAIVVTYVPFIIQAARESPPPADVVSAPAQSVEASAADAQDAVATFSVGDVAIALAFLIALAIAAPFLAGLENIIGLAILGFAVFEAWKINRRVPLVVTGPYAVPAAPSGSA